LLDRFSDLRVVRDCPIRCSRHNKPGRDRKSRINENAEVHTFAAGDTEVVGPRESNRRT